MLACLQKGVMLLIIGKTVDYNASTVVDSHSQFERQDKVEVPGSRMLMQKRDIRKETR